MHITGNSLIKMTFAKVSACLLALAFWSVPTITQADVYYVDDDASPGGDGLSWATAYSSIQDAVDAAFSDGGGEVWVAEGTYTNEEGSVLELKSGVSLIGGFRGDETSGEQRNWKVYSSIIDGGKVDRCLKVESASDVVLDGIILIDGWCDNGGGAVFCMNSSVKIFNCSFFNNRATDRVNGGGAIYFYNSASIIRDSIFYANKTEWRGGAIYSNSTSSLISGCQFIYNKGEYTGGIYSNHSTHTIVNCVFDSNVSDAQGGAITSSDSTTAITNCTFKNNLGFYSYNQSINIASESTMSINNCILWGGDYEVSGALDGVTISHSCLKGEHEGEGIIDSDPLFAQGSCRLLPESPCINTGSNQLESLPEEDILGNERIVDGYVDMGAYEFVPVTPLVNLNITLGPDQAMEDKPKWRVIGGEWQESSSPLTVYPGEYFIEFSKVIHWKEPALQFVSVPESGLTKTFLYSHQQNKYLWFVDKDATGDGTGKSWHHAFTDIQSAVDASSEEQFGEIWIAEGIYTSDGNPEIASFESDVNLYGGFAGFETERSQRNWYENKTILDGEFRNRCFDFYWIEHVIIDGFVFTNGRTALQGAGVNGYLCSFEVSNCIFIDNFTHYGAAFYGNKCMTSFYNCLFTGNISIFAGDCVRHVFSEQTFINCTFYGNGNPVYVFPNATVYNVQSKLKMVNCIMANKRDEIRGGEASVSYSCIKGGFEGEGNIDQDPILDLAEFRLLPSSPCIDQGTSDINRTALVDLLGEARVENGRVDMGAFEYTPGSDHTVLTVQLEPEDHLPNPPKWRVDQGMWMPSSVELELYPGEHLIEFSKEINWKEPDLIAIDVPSNGSTLTVSYLPALGNNLWYVDAGATGNNDGSSWRDAFTDIQSAVDAAEINGMGEVWIAEGTYTEGGSRINVSRDISLYGGFSGDEVFREDRRWDAGATIIDGQDRHPGLSIYSASINMVIDRIVFTKCKGIDGGAILLEGASPVISDCYFSQNISMRFGGALYSDGASTRVINCLFEGNKSECGGAIFNHDSTSVIVGCWFVNNSSDDDIAPWSHQQFGGGIFNIYSNVKLMNCLFDSNTAGYHGGALYSYNYCKLDITNCTFTRNTSGFGGCIYQSDHEHELNTVITNSILWGNSSGFEGRQPTVTYSCIEGGFDGEGNIDTDPRFRSLSTGDLRLTAMSPCIDAGTLDGAPESDIRNFPRPHGEGVDMGAYEYTNVSPAIEIIQTLLGVVPGSENYDLNDDEVIDAADLLRD